MNLPCIAEQRRKHHQLVFYGSLALANLERVCVLGGGGGVGYEPPSPSTSLDFRVQSRVDVDNNASYQFIIDSITVFDFVCQFYFWQTAKMAMTSVGCRSPLSITN